MDQTLSSQLAALGPHPRVLITAAEVGRIKSLVRTDALAAKMLELVVARAEHFLIAPLPQRIMEGRRLLGVARTVLSATLSLGLAALLTGEEKYVRRAIDTMLAAAGFSDWNPSHFLDVGEMTMALAAGYDWLHDKLSADERRTIEDAILDKGLREGAKVTEWWVTATNNWNPVCHGGLVFGAIAVAERDPELAAFTVRRAIENVPRIAKAYAPDGAYDEGSMYWGYGTTFLVLLIDALQKALGSTFGLDELPGLVGSARYMRHIVGPTGLNFNYSDNREGRYRQQATLWFADHCNDPSLAAGDLELVRQVDVADATRQPIGEGDRLLAMLLIWYRAAGEIRKSETAPLTWHGQGPTPVALMRTAWNDPNATYLAIKGGSPGVSHAHMDVGSFVLDAGGIRWIKDLGMQEYHSLESAGVNMWNAVQGGIRWKVFRLGPSSHSILRFGNDEQRVAETASLQFSEPAGTIGEAVVDLTTVSGPVVRSASRRATLQSNGTAVVEDRWTLAKPCESVTAQLITEADVLVAPRQVMLSKAGKSMELTIESSDPSVQIFVDDISAGPAATDAENPNAKRIRIVAHGKVGSEAFVRCTFRRK